MKNHKKTFIFIESLLALAVVLLVFTMFLEKNGKARYRISVVLQNSDDGQWSALKYGLKMAAEDQGMELFIVSTGGGLTAEEEKSLLQNEIDHGADAVIVQPAPGKETEQALEDVKKRVPVMLVEGGAFSEKEDSWLPVAGPDNYGMGKALAEELLKDYSGNANGKRFGILTEYSDSEALASRAEGFIETVEKKGAEISWFATDDFSESGKDTLESLPKVDVVAALDDKSLRTAGKCSAANNLHGALVYGIGHSTEAVYYLDTDKVQCLVVPDEFQAGYQSLTQVAQSLGHYFRSVKGQVVPHRALRKETLFLEENQDILFTMSQ